MAGLARGRGSEAVPYTLNPKPLTLNPESLKPDPKA